VTAVALKRVAHVIAGQSPPSNAVTELEGVGLPFLQGNAEFGHAHPWPIHRCDSAPKRAQLGDILLSVRAPVGALNLADREYGIGRGLAAIRPAGIIPRFAWWSLMSRVEELRAMATGSTFDAITAEDIGSLVVRLPSLSKQREIADFLDTETTRIDALIEKKRRMIVLAEQRFRSRAARTIFVGLNPITGEGELPDGWRRLRLGIAIALQRGFDLPDAERRDGPIPIISSGGRSGAHEVAMCDAPGVVTGRYGTVGEVHFIDEPYWPLNTTLFVADFRGNHPRWVFHLLRVVPLDIDAEKSAVTGINRNVVGALFVPLPPVAMQRELAAELDAEERRSAALEELLRQQISLLREHRQALISAAVTGQLDIAKAAA
jgi:type I restriction enzyme S subunit